MHVAHCKGREYPEMNARMAQVTKAPIVAAKNESMQKRGRPLPGRPYHVFIRLLERIADDLAVRAVGFGGAFPVGAAALDPAVSRHAAPLSAAPGVQAGDD